MAFFGTGHRVAPVVARPGYQAPSPNHPDVMARTAREQAEMDWATGATARRESEAQSLISDTQIRGRALRAMQRAFSTMNAIAMGGASAGGSPLGGNNRDPLGLASRPMGKSKFGV
jgi:hypothetical protein